MRIRSRRHQAWITLAAAATAVSVINAPAIADNPNPAKPAHVKPVGKALKASWKSKLHGPVSQSTKPASYFVRFRGAGGADAAAASGGRVAGTNTRAAAQRTSNAALGTAKGAYSKSTRLFTISNTMRGMGVVTNAKGAKALAKRSDVVSVTPLTRHTPSNANTANLVQALKEWKYAGGTGAGVTIGVIDTGLDYTHADFGGVGTAAAYAAQDSTDPNWLADLPALGKAKIIGGYDFAGDDYDADPTSANYQPVPHPDSNPLDCNEHGTHVSGTAAGYGVDAAGNTFTGRYDKLSAAKLQQMKIGPGMAPKAKIYALKVFGCEGSTDLTLPALDRALDPNGDGDFSDHLDIINMSLGSDYGPADDPENAVVDELSRHGVLSVIAMGNNGDLTDTGGSPGNAESSLAVASSVDSMQLRDGLKINAPAAVAGTAAGQMSIAYDWANAAPVTGDVAAIPGDNEDGCDPLSTADAAKVNGKVAWLIWDDNDTTRRCGSAGRSANVAAAGAIGAVFTSGRDVFSGGITGSAVIPVMQLPKAWVDKLQSAVDAGTLNVTFDGSLQGTIKDINNGLTDTLSDFSSRGTHGSVGVVKPDVAAPGDTITSAGVGTGNGQLTISGTSMATPLVAGVSALVRKQHPKWSTLQVKAAIMNTAGNDIYTGQNRTGLRYGPARVGAGRVNAFRAANTKVLAYVAGANNPVSVSFGPVPAPITEKVVMVTRKVTVQNVGSRGMRMRLFYDAVVKQPGVSYSVSPSSLWVRGKSKRTATVTMRIVPSSLKHSIDPTMETEQLDIARQYLSDASGHLMVRPGGGQPLRVPVYGAAKPVSMTKASSIAGSIKVSGTGVDTGDNGYVSASSVMQLGGTSGELPECVDGVTTDGCADRPFLHSGDIQYVGAGMSSDALWFGMSTYGDWANLGATLVPVVKFDTTGDGVPDFETDLQLVESTDLLYAVTYNLDTEEAVDGQPVNFNNGDVDTNIYDNNVVTIPVSREAIGLTDLTDPITYSISTYDLMYGGVIDSVDGSFDGSLSTEHALYVDAGNTTIGYTATQPTTALVFHLHGMDGKRAQLLSLSQFPEPAMQSSTGPSPADSPSSDPSGSASPDPSTTPSP